jgi:AcrR family transcriptional regulator
VAEAAARLGPAGLTVQAVADALGVTRAAIYHYVGDVEELRQLAAYAGDPPLPATAADDADRSWQDRLRDFARATRAWRLDHGEPYLVLAVDGPGTDRFATVIDRAIGVLVEAGFSPGRARHAFQFLVGVVWINAQDELTDRPGGTAAWWLDPDARFERELDWVIHALEQEVDPS